MVNYHSSLWVKLGETEFELLPRPPPARLRLDYGPVSSPPAGNVFSSLQTTAAILPLPPPPFPPLLSLHCVNLRLFFLPLRYFFLLCTSPSVVSKIKSYLQNKDTHRRFFFSEYLGVVCSFILTISLLGGGGREETISVMIN